MAELRDFLPESQVQNSPGALEKYSDDWSKSSQAQATSVVFPTSIEEIQKVVHWANQTRTPLVPSGGRSGLSGGACATKGAVILSLERMNRIWDFDPVQMSIRCEAGVILQTLQEWARENELFFPIDLGARGSCQIGGNIATNAGGMYAVKHGRMDRWILGLRAVTGRGEIFDLDANYLKDARGPALKNLFIGSEGTLGVIADARLRLTSAPAPTEVLLMGIPSLDLSLKVTEIFRHKTDPLALEWMSRSSFEQALKGLGLAEPLARPHASYLLIEASGDILAAFQKAKELIPSIDAVVAQSQAQAQVLWSYRDGISEVLARDAPVKLDISLPLSRWSTLEEYLLEKRREFSHVEVYTFGHLGDGNLHLNLIGPAEDCKEVEKALWEKTIELEGSPSAEHGIGLLKLDALQDTVSSPHAATLQALKKHFDPQGILNPGKLIP